MLGRIRDRQNQMEELPKFRSVGRKKKIMTNALAVRLAEIGSVIGQAQPKTPSSNECTVIVKT